MSTTGHALRSPISFFPLVICGCILIMVFLLRQFDTLIAVKFWGFSYELTFLIMIGLLAILVSWLLVASCVCRPRKLIKIHRGLINRTRWIILWIGIVLLIHHGSTPFGDQFAAILLYLIPAAFFVLVSGIQMNRREQLMLLNIYVLAGGGIGALSILFPYIGPVFGKVFKWENVNFQGGVVRTFSSLGGATLVGAFLLLVFPVATYFGAVEKRSFYQGIYYTAAVFMALGILMTLSRGSIILLGVQVAWLILRSGRVAKIKYLSLALVILVLGVWVSYMANYLDILISRFNGLKEVGQYSLDTSVGSRALSFKGTLRYALNHPLFGSGPSQYFSRIELMSLDAGVLDAFVNIEDSTVLFQSHSAYLLVLSEFGFPGLILLLATFTYIAKMVWRGIQSGLKNNDKQGVLLLKGLYMGVITLFAWVTISDSIFLFHRPATIFWIYCGLALNLSFSIRYRSPHGYPYRLDKKREVLGWKYRHR